MVSSSTSAPCVRCFCDIRHEHQERWPTCCGKESPHHHSSFPTYLRTAGLDGGDLHPYPPGARPRILLPAIWLLVADPVSTLLMDLVPLSALQCAYAILCLPPASSRQTLTQPLKAKSRVANGKRNAAPKPAQGVGAKITVASSFEFCTSSV